MFAQNGLKAHKRYHKPMQWMTGLVLLTLLCASVAAPLGLAQSGATIRLAASPAQINVGSTSTVTLHLENVSNLYGVEITLTFDPASLEVQDANASTTGVQVALGSFLSPDFVVRNAANNTTGMVDIAFTQVSPSQPVSGSGVLATIVFKGKKSGTSTVNFQKTLLSNPNGEAIAASPSGTSIVVGTGAPTHTPTPTATTGPAQPTSTPTATKTPGPSQPTPTATPVPGGFYYTVQRGDNLFRIALRFGTTIQAIAQANGIVNPRLICVGQVLWIPSASSGTPTTVYIVQRGDTLYSIARRFGTTYQALAAANGIANPRLIYVGQKLVIPQQTGPGPGPTPTPSPSRVHVVQRGDTLYSIALRYGTTTWAIVQANGLRNPNLIYPGQRLIIP